MGAWDEEVQRAISHPIRRRIIECLQGGGLSFTELLSAVDEINHGKFGYHLRTLRTFVELDPLTKKYRLTHRGMLLAGLIRDFRFFGSLSGGFERYVQGLRGGDHAFALYDTEGFKRRITFPFLRAGLSKGEAVVYLVSENKLDSVSRQIRRYGIDLDSLREGAFTAISAYDWYIKRGKAQAKKIIANWQRLLKEKQKAGFTALRAASEIRVFLDHARSRELLRYEAALGRQLASNFCGLCLYDADRVGEDLIRVFDFHGHVISRGIVGKMKA
ncbi:MAG: MEDS domain-containing protein [Candidatus Bathyarchaeia archaeon]